MTVDPVVVRQGDVSVVQLAGEIDLATAGQVQQAVLKHVGDGPALALDFTDVSFLDSAGVRMLDNVAAACADADVRLRVVVPPDTHVRFTLSICAFPEDLINDSVDQAVQPVAPADEPPS